MSSGDPRPVLIGGHWRAARAAGHFRAANPQTRKPIGPLYPVSTREDVDDALRAGIEAAGEIARASAERIAAFLETFARNIESAGPDLVRSAHEETALPASPRLADVELPRTTDQIRQAAAAVKSRSWTMPTIDTKADIRSMYGPLGGPVAVFGPNNFPFAFNSIAGGDFAAAVAAGNPVIAKANPGHPRTTEMLARLAHEALLDIDLPPAVVQLLYMMSNEDGERFVSHPSIAATAFTGTRSSALALKRAADRAGKLFYMETGGVNPVVILPGALRERLPETVEELAGSCLLGTGQFCTQPGLVLLLAGDTTEDFVSNLIRRFEESPTGTLLGEGVERNLERSVEGLMKAGAERLTGGSRQPAEGFGFQNTLLRVDGDRFLKNPLNFQREAFGNETLLVIAHDTAELVDVLGALDGNLTGSIYTSRDKGEDALYAQVARILRRKVGRLLNDKMPTGVAVSPAMNHGGPYPAASHPGFTAVGMPPAILRFAALHCYDNVREHRLPVELKDKNLTGRLWRRVDGEWTRGDITRV